MAESLEAVDFKILFESGPQLNLVLTKDLMIVAASDEYLRATMTTRDILGRSLFDVFPENPADPTATGIRNLRASLDMVLKHRVPHTMAVQKYDIRRSALEGGEFEERFWSPVNSPVLGTDGEVRYIIHRVEDVTEFVHLKQEGSQRTLQSEELLERAEKMEREVFLRAQEIQKQTAELEGLNKDLQVARDQALAASRFKSEFLARMSHEIRTPMNGILGMSEIILSEVLPPKIRRYVTIIRDAGQSLLAVINDILDFSKVEAGKLALEIVGYEPVMLVESIGELLTEQAINKNVSLVTYIDPSIPQMLNGDPIRLRQILMNLAGNAIKFSDQGEVLISATLEEQLSDSVILRFSVTDQGIGLSANEIAKLFEPFVQQDASRNLKYGGTGLGLSISKRFVELMRGKIGVESQKGKGSTFWFTVEQSYEPTECAFRQSGPLLNTTGAVATRDELILVVEDHLINQEVALLLLRNLGFEAHVASNGRLALAAMSRSPYSLIFMDVQMPEMGGLETTEAIRKRERGTREHVPIIAMTAHAIDGTKDTCISAGMDDYITKPIDPAVLKATVDKWLPITRGFSDADEKDGSETCTRDPIDLAALAQNYGASRVSNFVKLFLDVAPRQISDLRQAAQDGNFDELSQLAHGLKGSSATVFAHTMRDTCVELESAVRFHDMTVVLSLISRLETHFEAVELLLRQRQSH